MSSFSNDAKWVIATVKLKDRRTFYRICIERPKLPDLRSYRVGVILEWIFDESEALDVPSGDVAKAINQFEEAILDLETESDRTLMACVTTGAGMKEWLYYTKDYDAFMADLNRLLAAHEKFPITIEYDDDPDWFYWGTICERLKKKSDEKTA